MRRFIALPLLLLTTVLVSVLVPGCGGGTDVAAPRSPPPAPVSTSPSPSPSPSAARESAKDFIRRFTAAEDAVQNSGDTSAYAPLTDGCASCDALISQVNRIYAAHGMIHYDGTRILWIRALGHRTFDYRVRVGRTVYRESDTGRTRKLNGGEVTYEIELRRAGNSWVAVRTARLAATTTS